MSHSTSILSGICKYYYGKTSQMIAQRLPFPTTNKPNVHVIRRYHKHLHDGTKTVEHKGQQPRLLVLVHGVSVLIVLHTSHR
jgi:hypothetical protein